MTDKIIIRPSSLTTWLDCNRRGAARLFAVEIHEAGYTLNHTLRHIGAAVGTAVHAAAAYTMRSKLRDGTLGNATERDQVALESLKVQFEHEVIFDGATGNLNTAQKQTVRMGGSYEKNLAPHLTPVMVEERLEIDIGGGFVVSGQGDSLVEENYGIRDLKTGTVRRVNATQYGAYGMIYRAHGRPIEQLVEDYLKRVPLANEQPPPVSYEIPIKTAIAEASELLGEMKRRHGEWRRRLTDGDLPPEMAFAANPNSMLCSRKFCPAHGTDFCKAHQVIEKPRGVWI